MKDQETYNKTKDNNEVYLSLKKTLDRLTNDLENVNARRDEIIRKATVKIDKERDVVKNELIKYQKSMNELFPEATFEMDAGWKEKIIWAVRTSSKVMSISEIVAKIKKHEQDKDKNILPIIRLTTYRMAEKEELYRYKTTDTSNIHYALPEWFESGKLMEGYL